MHRQHHTHTHTLSHTSDCLCRDSRSYHFIFENSLNSYEGPVLSHVSNTTSIFFAYTESLDYFVSYAWEELTSLKVGACFIGTHTMRGQHMEGL